MEPKIRHGKKASPATATPVGVRKPRPFADPAPHPEAAQASDPGFEAGLERAARYGHSLDRIAAPADRPSPPAGGPVLQRMKRGSFPGNTTKRKKQKTQAQPTLHSFFAQRPPQQQNNNTSQPSTTNIQPPTIPNTPSGTVSNLVSVSNSNLAPVSNVASTTNSILNLAPETEESEVSNLPPTPEQEKPQPKFSFSELQKQQKQLRLKKLKEKYPHLQDVPDDWIRLGAHNPEGPEITLHPPTHQGPNEQTLTQGKDHPLRHVVDLSTGSYQIYRGKEEPVTYKIDREGEDADATMSDVRNYAMLTNAYLSAVGPKAVQETKRTEKDSLGSIASKIASKERKSNKATYGKKIVGHVPDSSISGVPHSPMGFLPMTSDANAIVGNASGIGLKAWNKATVGSILVKETGGHLHYYNLPSRTDGPSDDDNSASIPHTTTANTTGSSNNNALPVDSNTSQPSLLDDWDSDTELAMLQSLEELDKGQAESKDRSLPHTTTTSSISNNNALPVDSNASQPPLLDDWDSDTELAMLQSLEELEKGTGEKKDKTG